MGIFWLNGGLTSLVWTIRILHIVGGFRRSSQEESERTLPSVLLGIVEIDLGIALLYPKSEVSRPAVIGISIWALAGGGVLLSDALCIRQDLSRQQPENSD